MPFFSGEKRKPRAGFFKFSCCTGCGFELAYFQRSLEDTLKSFDFTFFRLAYSSGAPEGPFDLALVEGTVTEPHQAVELKRIRENSAVLYAVGSCAIAGGIPAIKAGGRELEIEKRVYQKKLYRLTSMRPSVLSDYVKVDGCVRGCPPGRRDLEEALVSILLHRRPEFIEYSVCVECKLRGNICLLVDEGLPCMGPVTNAGCGALCPACHRACYSCFGLMSQANIPALKNKFRELGLSGEEIERRFTLFDALRLKK